MIVQGSWLGRLPEAQQRADGLRGLTLSALMMALIVVTAECGDIEYAAAQEPDEAAALTLARVCWGEASATGLDECTAIGTVLARRSVTGTVTTSIARRYSSALRGHSRHVRPWLLELDASGDRPPSWPRRLSWAEWRPHWLALLEHSRRIVAGEVASTCDRPPDHWGAPYGVDYQRAQRAGWRQVHCGRRTRNSFWRVNGRRR